MSYDVIVVGGGSAGLMASVSASVRLSVSTSVPANISTNFSADPQNIKVLLIDKGDRLGRKLGISGGGRCNVTNAKEVDELIGHIPGNGRFLYSALETFGNQDIIAFFEGLGIRLKEEDHGRMFPVTDKAKTVVDALINKIRALGVEILVNSPVDAVLYQNGRAAGVRLKTGKVIESRNVILATGGKSVPHTGSTGDGYAWAEAAGHTITELFPTEVPLTSNESYIRNRELQGLSLRNVSLTVWNQKGKKLISHQGDMLFTHFGLSGPIALRCSQFVVKEIKKTNTHTVDLSIDLYPDKTCEEIYNETLNLAKSEPKKAIKNILKAMLPEKMIPLLLKKSSLDEQLTYDNIPKQNWIMLSQCIKGFHLAVNGTLSLEEAFVTGGGVNLKEIDPKTMQSKLMEGLYFCGEILDIHGYTGGYNITAAFSTGFTAGQHAARTVLEGRNNAQV